MLLIPCPHCGPRDAAEFGYVGERGPRPDPNTTTPSEWRRYLYERRNPAGWADELWFHRTGCRRYLAIRRDTVTGDISAAVIIGSSAGAYPRTADDHGKGGGG